jgi:drug/metabolite transporter (DMT)-like permease
MDPSPAPRPPAARFIAAFAAIYLIWGSTYLGIRIAIESMPPFAMAAQRFLVAGVLLFGFVLLRGAAWPRWHQWRDNFAAGTLLLLGGNGLMSWAEQTIPSGVTALLVGIGPIFTVLVDWLWTRDRPPTRLTAAGMLLGFSGVLWLAAPWEHGKDSLNSRGVAAVLCASLAWAFGAIYTRHARRPADPIVASSLQMLGGGGALLLAAWLHHDFAHYNPAAVTLRSWAAFAYLVAMGSLVGFSTFVWLMKHSTPARVSTYAYVNPVVAVFLGWVVAGETLNARTVAATVVIVAAVMIITLQSKPTRAQPAAPLPEAAPDA